MSGPLYEWLIRMGVPAGIALAVSLAASVLVGGCSADLALDGLRVSRIPQTPPAVMQTTTTVRGPLDENVPQK